MRTKDSNKDLSSYYSMSSSGEIEKLFKVSIENVQYSFAIDNPNKIKYIQTKDSNYKSSEGLMIGSTLQKVKKATSYDMITKPGWGYAIYLPSGWYVAFFVGDTGTEFPPSDSIKVGLFYKVRDND